MDKPVSQCLIVAQLIETTHSKDLEAGLNYTMPTYTHNVDDPLSHQNWGTKMTFGVTSSLNEALTNGKVLSRPVITTEMVMKQHSLWEIEYPFLSNLHQMDLRI